MRHSVKSFHRFHFQQRIRYFWLMILSDRVFLMRWCKFFQDQLLQLMSAASRCSASYATAPATPWHRYALQVAVRLHFLGIPAVRVGAVVFFSAERRPGMPAADAEESESLELERGEGPGRSRRMTVLEALRHPKCLLLPWLISVL